MGLNLKQLFQNEYSFEETINENFFKVDVFSQSLVIDRITNHNDENIINNKLYLIAENTDALFGDKTNQLVCYNANLGWMFYSPYVGKMIFLQSENKYYFFNGTIWEEFTANSNNDNIDMVLNSCLLKENNLLDINDKDVACHNIGTLTEQEIQSTFLCKSKNLLDITNQDQACHNIGTLRDWEIRKVGDYKMSAQKQDHENWFICDGREVLRSEYPELFSIISTDFGAGNGTTTFNIPNFKNRTPWGADGNLNSTLNSGLPNITGYYKPGSNIPMTNIKTTDAQLPTIANGAFSVSMETTAMMLSTSHGNSVKPKIMEFDASKSNAIYGGSNIVQPPAICVNMFILMK